VDKDDDLEALTFEGQISSSSLIEGKALSPNTANTSEDMEEGIPPNEGTFRLEKKSSKKRKLSEGEGEGEGEEESSKTPKTPSKKKDTEEGEEEGESLKSKEKNKPKKTEGEDLEEGNGISPKKTSGSKSAKEVIKEGARFIGCCKQEDECYPMSLIVKKTKEKSSTYKVSGNICWLSLKAQTKFKGKLIGKQLTFKEYEAISGADQVEIPMKYRGTLRNDVELVGRSLDGDKETETKLTLSLDSSN